MGRLARAAKIGLMVLGGWVAAQVAVRIWRRLFPAPVSPIVSPIFEAPLREIGQPRHVTFRHIGLGPGMRVLEIGAGDGFYTCEAARLIGPEGRLTAVNSQPRAAALLADRVHREGAANVEVRLAEATNLPFPDGTFDLAFLVTSLGEIADKGRALRELRRVLKPNGRLSITEAMADADYMLMAEVVGWAQAVGFELVEQHGNALVYTLNFRSLFGP